MKGKTQEGVSHAIGKVEGCEGRGKTQIKVQLSASAYFMMETRKVQAGARLGFKGSQNGKKRARALRSSPSHGTSRPFLVHDALYISPPASVKDTTIATRTDTLYEVTHQSQRKRCLRNKHVKNHEG